MATAGTQLWRDGILWAEAALLQCARYRASRWANISAELDAAARLVEDAIGEGPGRAAVLVPTGALRRQERAELAFLLAALGNTVRAERRLPPRHRTSAAGIRGALQALRDLSLCWDEPGTVPKDDGSDEAAALRAVFAGLGGLRTDGAGGEDDDLAAAEEARFSDAIAADPPSVLGLSLSAPDEVWLSGVPLSRIEAWLEEAHAAFDEALVAAGAEMAEPLESWLPGDDLTAWPAEAERVRPRRWEELRERDRGARGALRRLAALVDALLGIHAGS